MAFQRPDNMRVQSAEKVRLAEAKESKKEPPAK
jgi:hypothetical protein